MNLIEFLLLGQKSRLTLRHDNADHRLLSKANEIGLIDEIDWKRFNHKRDRLILLRNTLSNQRYKRSDIEYSSISQTLNIDLGDSISLSETFKKTGCYC